MSNDFFFYLVRTKMLNCKNDADFRIKLYCLRVAFQVRVNIVQIFSDLRCFLWLLIRGLVSIACSQCNWFDNV